MVEVYNGRTVVRKSLNGPRASGEAFGTGVGQGLQQLGQGIENSSDKAFKTYQAQREKEDITVVVDLENQLSEFRRERLNGDHYARQGKNALNSLNEYEKELDKWKNKATKGLSNENQARLFEQVFDRTRNADLTTLQTHVTQEKVRWQNDVASAKVKNSFEDALANYTNSDLVDKAYNSGLAALQANYFGQGEVLDQKIREYDSQFYKLQVMRKADDDAEVAKAYYEQHKKDIVGTEHSAIEEILQKKKEYQAELPMKLAEREVKVLELQDKLNKFDKQKSFETEITGMDDAQALKHLEQNEPFYSEKWFKAKQKALLSAKGISAETRAEKASEKILKIAELSSLMEEDYLKSADSLLAELEDDYAEGELTLGDKIRLQNSIYKAREKEVVSLGEKDDWFWRFSFKDANERIVKNSSNPLATSKIMLDYFRSVEGQELSNSEKKDVLDKLVKSYNEKDLLGRISGTSASQKKLVKIGKYDVEVE